MESQFTFDFDQWATLSRNDPQAFEHLRTQVVDAYCQQMDAQHRPWLANMRWRIDAERARSRSPLQCCLRLSSLMWDRFLDLNEMLQTGKTPLRQVRNNGHLVTFKKYKAIKEINE